MNVKGTDPSYWDDGQSGPNYRYWFKKGFWKKYYRKKFYKKYFKNNESWNLRNIGILLKFGVV